MAGNSKDLLEFAKVQHNQRVQSLAFANKASDRVQNFIFANKMKSKAQSIMVSSKTIDKIKSKAILAKSLPSTQMASGSIIRIVPKFKKDALVKEENVTLKSSSTKPQNIYSASTSSELPTLEKFEVCSNNSDDNYELFEEASNDSTNERSPVKDKQDAKRNINILKRNYNTVGSHSTISLPQNKIRKAHGKQCCACCRETLETILQQQQEILRLLKDPKHSTLESSLSNKLDLLPQMPFNDINDFLDFDESMANENVQHQFITKIKRLLVSTEQKSIANIMSAIFTNELCKSISWIGVKDTIPFGTSNIVNPIVELLQSHHQINIDLIKSRLAEWLRRCGDRINNEEKRRQKRLSQGYPTVSFKKESSKDSGLKVDK